MSVRTNYTPDLGFQQELHGKWLRLRQSVMKSSGAQRSFSQHGEDILLHDLFSGSTGNYVDIGAGEPAKGSNTYSFYRAGWHGVCVEPILHNVTWGRKLRPRDHYVHALCGDSKSTAEFYEFLPYQYSTADAVRASALVESGIPLKATYSLLTIPLRELEVRARPSEPSFLSIDVEGWEKVVLQTNDWNEYCPSAICVEEWEYKWGEPTEVNELLAKVGYRLIARTGWSNLYIHHMGNFSAGWATSD
jgi:FkbM family methyltransferase